MLAIRVAAILDDSRALPATIAAVALHVALVAALPHARTTRVFDLSPPAEVELSEPAPEPPPPPLAAAVALPTGGGASAPAHAPAAAPRREPIENVPDRTPAGPADFDPSGPSGEGPPGLPPGSGPPGSGPPGPPGPPSTALVPAPPPPPPPAVDRSRAPSLARGDKWSCPWPAEAEEIDEAVAVVAITVDTTGHASRVEVLADPGHGFGREARRCALREIYTTALDREARPIVSTTKPIRVRFSR